MTYYAIAIAVQVLNTHLKEARVLLHDEHSSTHILIILFSSACFSYIRTITAKLNFRIFPIPLQYVF